MVILTIMHCSRRIMRSVVSLLFGLVLSVPGFHARAETVIHVGSYQDHVAKVREFIARNGCQSLEEADIGQNQILAEYLIFCNALKLADTRYRIKLYAYPLNARILDDVAQGFLDASAVGIWRSELAGASSLASAALLKRNQFEKGLYTTKANLRTLNGKTSLNGKVVLANSNWFEWRMLQCSDLKPVHVGQYENMFGMLHANRGDLIPLTFSNQPGLERHHFNVPLYPVTGVKLAFADSTHFAVRDTADNTNALMTDLNAGINQLRQDGRIEDVYRRLGLINPAAESWTAIGQCND